MRNSYQQAAEKMGIGLRTLRRMVSRREIGIIRITHKTRLITDAEISRVIEQRTRRAEA